MVKLLFHYVQAIWGQATRVSRDRRSGSANVMSDSVLVRLLFHTGVEYSGEFGKYS